MKASPKYLLKLSHSLLKAWLKVQEHLKNCVIADHKPPTPSNIREVFQAPNLEMGYSPARFSQMLGGRPSESTILRVSRPPTPQKQRKWLEYMDFLLRGDLRLVF